MSLLNFLTVISGMIKLSHQSIAGVTYMDNFDFEERYENIHDCDPLYWHPLHMPEHCAKMYEKLIRSKISKLRPVHEEEAIQPMVYDMSPTIEYTYSNSRRNSRKSNRNLRNSHQKSRNSYQNSRHLNHRSEKSSKRKSRSRRRPSKHHDNKDDEAPSIPLYETMLKLLRADVMREPAQPKIGLMPNLGIVAYYKQPVSSLSEQVIKEVSSAYSQAVAQAYKNAASIDKKYSDIPKTYRHNGTYDDPDTLIHYQIKLYPGIEGLPGSPQYKDMKENIKTDIDLAKQVQNQAKTESKKNKKEKQLKTFKKGNMVAIFENTK